MKKILPTAVLSYLCILLLHTSLWAGISPRVSIVSNYSEGAVAHGINSIRASLECQNISYDITGSVDSAQGDILIVAGLFTDESDAARLVNENHHQVLTAPESLDIWETTVGEKTAWIVNGSDQRGLMYGLLDVAKQISRINDHQYFKLEAKTESASLSTRAISLYTMNRAYWESRFYDENYWTAYLDNLAENRFNSMVVIFGYENGGFLAPCYPYFFDVEGFPEVKMGNMTAREQQKNLDALNRLIEMAHDRGIEFKIGIWDHIYRGGVQGGGLSEEELATFDNSHLVRGVTAENLLAYNRAALTKFIEKVPDLDGIQFRMHNESGLKRGKEMELFWTEIFNMLRDNSADFKIDLRAKELPEEIIQIAIDLNLNFTVTTKYWMEQMGLPYHPTHINRENQLERRHGYADMLQYPKRYNVHWRLWNMGPQRILLWGDPTFVKRFLQSTHLYDGDGFEVNEPLATKMEAQPHDEAPFDLLNPAYVYYKYEFERYWYFFNLYGQLGFNPDLANTAWDQAFDQHYGAAGPIIQEALHRASWVLPMIVTACAPYSKFPTTRGWAEKQRFGDLPQYAAAEGSDIQQFASFDTEAKLLVEGGETPKRRPSSTRTWFLQTHQAINALIEKAEALTSSDNKELNSTLVDLKILSNLALYHANRIPAAVSYRIYQQTKDPSALSEAIDHEKKAIDAWKKIIASAGDVYASNLKFGVRESFYMGINHQLTGHWTDELKDLENGLHALESERMELGKSGKNMSPKFQEAEHSSYHHLYTISHEPVKNAPINQDITIQAKIQSTSPIKWVRLRYRAVNQHLDYETLSMTDVDEDGVYTVTVPSSDIDPHFDFMYFIEVMDTENHGIIYPDLEKETPYYFVSLDR